MEVTENEISKRKVFISYSWTNEDHEQWVVSLATRLREDGVDIVLDKWDLKEGQDVHSFMESMVNSLEIDKVLIICDKAYKMKAEARKGGVGTETQIITSEIYGNISQEKFIPIVTEKDDDGNICVPTYIKTRKYIDMSSNDLYESGYETLLRNLFERPQYRKPALGLPPAWLFDNEKPHYKTANIIKQLQNVIENNPARFKGLIKRFIDSFFECLEQVQLIKVENGEEFDQKIYNLINDLIDLRNDYITFVELTCEANEKVDIDPFIKFFEQLYNYTQPQEESTSYYQEQWDHFKFLARELLIYTIMVFFEYDKYVSASELLNAEYFVERRGSDNIRGGFDLFSFGIRSIDVIRKSRLKSDRLSLSAEMMVQRTTLKKYPKHKFLRQTF